jgi:hypothetical protein
MFFRCTPSREGGLQAVHIARHARNLEDETEFLRLVAPGAGFVALATKRADGEVARPVRRRMPPARE